MRLAALCLIFCILLQSLSRSLLLIRYHLNKKYYSEVLCSNKGLIVIDCEGQCRLLEEVQEEEKRSMTIPGFEKTELSTLPATPAIVLPDGRKHEREIVVRYDGAVRTGWITLPYKPPQQDSYS